MTNQTNKEISNKTKTSDEEAFEKLWKEKGTGTPLDLAGYEFVIFQAGLNYARQQSRDEVEAKDKRIAELETYSGKVIKQNDEFRVDIANQFSKIQSLEKENQEMKLALLSLVAITTHYKSGAKKYLDTEDYEWFDKYNDLLKRINTTKGE